MKGRDLWLAGILLVSLVLCVDHLWWGLPNGNASWAADAYGPITVLGVLRRSFAGWNSGWFYFKYPLGYPLELGATYAPYLAYLWVSGGWSHPAPEYPYGFADPERALLVLGLCGRALSVAFTLGSVALTAAIGGLLFGAVAGRLAAWFVATCFAVVYYAHTTNLDAGYLCWLLLAWYCALAAGRSESRRPWIGLGAAAAMAVSTKEQGFAFLLPLPVLAVAGRMGRGALGTARGMRWMVGAAGATVLVANNALVNPLGFVKRIAYLLGHPLEPVSARLAPVDFAWFKGAEEWDYLRKTWDGLDSALGTPLLAVAVVGAALVWRRPRAAVWVLAPAGAYYYLALRSLQVLGLRYVLPLVVVASILAGAVLAEAVTQRRARSGRMLGGIALVGLAILGLLRAVETDDLLRTDSRYEAEAWMRGNVWPGARVEAYQKAVYLPRFRREISASHVPIGDRSVAGLAARRPDFIVVSSASRKSIFSVWTPDWRTSRSLLTPVPAARDLLHGLESGRLGYRVAATFKQEPRWVRPRITSFCPRIAVYARDDG